MAYATIGRIPASHVPMTNNFHPTPKEFEHLAHTLPFWRINGYIRRCLSELDNCHQYLRITLRKEWSWHKLTAMKTAKEYRLEAHTLIEELRFWKALRKRKKEIYTRPLYTKKV